MAKFGDYTPPPDEAEVIEVGFAKQEVVDSTKEEGKKVMKLPIKESFTIGEKVFLKVKTLGLIGKKLKVEVRQAVENQLTEKDQKIEALSVAEMTVGKITQSEDAKNKYDTSNLRALENIAMKEMMLEPKTEEDKKKWKDILAKSKEKKIKLYFHVEVLDAEGEVTYKGDDEKDKKNFLTKTPFELTEGGKCFCNRDLTVDEVKNFYGNKKLFIASNCPLPENSKNYTEFTKALNLTLKKYEINTCIRKAHFLAQIEAETRFETTLEYATGWDYDHTTHYAAYLQYPNEKDPKKKAKLKRGYDRYKECLSHGHNVKGYGPKYKGRGLIQTTWKDTYEKYFEYLGKPEFITTPEVIANNLTYTCDSAGWYWRKRSAWGDLNKFADNDDFISISVGVNGGLNGFEHRKSNLKTIFKFMNISTNCVNNKLKNIGLYKYETSNIRNSNWGKKEKNKKAIQKFDD